MDPNSFTVDLLRHEHQTTRRRELEHRSTIRREPVSHSPRSVADFMAIWEREEAARRSATP